MIEKICSSFKNYVDSIIDQVSKYGRKNSEPSSETRILIFWLKSPEMKFGIQSSRIRLATFEDWKSLFDLKDHLKNCTSWPNLDLTPILFKYVSLKAIEEGEKKKSAIEYQNI